MLTAGVILLENAAATGAAQQWPGGRGVFAAVGNFGAGPVALEFLATDGAGGTWVPVEDAAGAAVSLAANGMAVFELPPCPIRATVAGGATGIYASAARIPQ